MKNTTDAHMQRELLDMCERLLGFAHHYAHPSALLAGESMLANAKALIAQAKGAER